MLVDCITSTMNSQAPVRDWHVWQKSRTGRAKNWAGQKPVPGNGPVVGNKQSQKGKTWQGLWQAVAVKVSPGGWC